MSYPEHTTILVLGAGESGTGAALLARRKGLQVFLSDAAVIKDVYVKELQDAGIAFESGGHSERCRANYDVVIKSPGIPSDAELVRYHRRNATVVCSEIDFAARFSRAKFIGITGTNGKSTTTHLTYHVLMHAGLDVGIAGNMGVSLARALLQSDHDYFVLELSSFQLDDTYDLRLHIAILLNITPDHLNRYNYDFGLYIQSKFRILNNQQAGDYFIYNTDDEVIQQYLQHHPPVSSALPISLFKEQEEGAYIHNQQLIINHKHQTFTMSIQDLALQGKHNQYNSMAAGISARALEIRSELIRESLSDFQNIEHRLEFVAKIHGIEFINDSKATNVNSTWYALESMNNPVVWIAGGQDKGNDYAMLTDLVKSKVKAIVCLGKDNKKIIKAFKNLVPVIEETATAQEAVRRSYKLASKGDIVLLSPACASFDLFENFEDRGHQFKVAVRGL